MRPAPLRDRLLLLAAVAILPLALMSGIALTALLEQQRHQAEQSSLGLARALATAVDMELRLTVSALQSLALTAPLGSADDVDLADAYDAARRVLAGRPEWRSVSLATPAGGPLFNTATPFGAPTPPVTEPESHADVARTRAPVVGRLAFGPSGDPGVAVRVPVERGRKLHYVLTAVVRPEAILRVVNAQRVPNDWIVSVFDDQDRRVARSRDHERFLGTPPSPTLQAMLASLGDANERVGATTTMEGERVHTAVARVRSAHWVVALGVPASVEAGTLRDSALAYGGGILLSLGLGSVAAWLLSGSIAAPIARLRDAAAALGRGAPVEDAKAGLVEIEAVSEALVSASALRRQGEAEREQLLDAEREARASAERSQARLQQLVSVGALLSRSLEEETTLAAIGSLIVPDIADICRIDLLDRDGVLQRKLTRHVDPQRQSEMLDFVQRNASTPDSPGSFAWTVATGQTFFANLEAGAADQFSDPAFRSFVQGFGIGAACVVPLVARGRTIGAMCALQAESGRSFGEADGALIGELAQRAALALDNVRLFGESREALREAEIANRTKDEFLAMLGHELRNPLAPIVTSLEVMARRDGADEGRERRIIERQVARLARMVDDLLDVSRIASGKIELRRESLDLRQVIARALELAAPVLQARAPPEVSLPEDAVWVSGDALRLTQVVCNLLTNAAKFSARDEPIAIVLGRRAGRAVLDVRDHGVGIPAELLPHVFERFVQGEQALQRASGGLGLGLAIARNLVELHGGAIEAASEGAGRGACFTIVLPQVDAVAAAPAPPTADAAAAPTRPTCILVVDDNDDAAQSLALVLQFEGHTVRTAGDGEQALRLLEEFVPEAAILDIGLPGMNGYELAVALRADPRTQGIVLIALTGYGRDPDRRRALDAGFDEHLVKPVEFELLLARLTELHARDANFEAEPLSNRPQ